MRKFSIAVAALTLCLLVADAWARGGGGAARGGAGPRGGDYEGRSGSDRGPGNDLRRGWDGIPGDDVGGGETPAPANDLRGEAPELRERAEPLGTGIGKSRLVKPQVIYPEKLNRVDAGQVKAGEAGRDAATQAFAGRPNKETNPAQRSADRQSRYNEVNRQLADQRENFRDLFTHDFWRTNPHPHWIFRGPWDRWWQAPAWAALAAWGDWTWAEPVAYNYGEDIYYDGNTVYQDGEPAGSAEDYAQQAETLATDVPQADPNHVEWMPLGVFALSLDGEASGPEPTILLQLAVSKEGIIAGTYLNTSNDEKQSLEGAVDIKTQRAAWTVVDEKWPVFETGIYNLTENTVPVLIHFADGQTQQRLLVRVNQPGPADENSDPTAASE